MQNINKKYLGLMLVGSLNDPIVELNDLRFSGSGCPKESSIRETSLANGASRLQFLDFNLRSKEAVTERTWCELTWSYKVPEGYTIEPRNSIEINGHALLHEAAKATLGYTVYHRDDIEAGMKTIAFGGFCGPVSLSIEAGQFSKGLCPKDDVISRISIRMNGRLRSLRGREGDRNLVLNEMTIPAWKLVKCEEGQAVR